MHPKLEHHSLTRAGSPMGKNRLRCGFQSRAGKVGQHPQFAWSTAPGPSSHSMTRKESRSGCLTRPRSVPRKHAQFTKGQIGYRPAREDPLRDHKVFSAKGLPLVLRKDFRARKAAKMYRLYGRRLPGLPGGNLPQPANSPRFRPTSVSTAHVFLCRVPPKSPRCGGRPAIVIRYSGRPMSSCTMDRRFP